MRIISVLVLFALFCCSEGHKNEECVNRDIPVLMFRDMINTSRKIQKSVSKDDKHHSFLKNLRRCTKKMNVADFKRLLEIYSEHVFQKLQPNDTLELPSTFMDHFTRLKDSFDGLHCKQGTKEKQTLSVCAREDLKLLGKTFKQLKPDGVIKALSEFHTVLLWIGLMDRRNTHIIH